MSVQASDVADLVAALDAALRACGGVLVTAESCTGGGVATACTDRAGSSDWFDRGFVTYSNDAKVQMLGVDPALIAAHGAVSEAVARAMALGAIERMPRAPARGDGPPAPRASLSVAITGIAGPGGGSAAKPVGTVWFAWARRTGDEATTCIARCVRFEGDRAGVRTQAVRTALQGLLTLLRAGPGAP